MDTPIREVEIRIRHENDTTAVPLCTVPFDQIATVIPTLREWGIFMGVDTYVDATGQFVVDEGSAYFEVVVGGG